MPSFWKRIGLAAALTAQISASPVLTFAQQPCTNQTRCATTQPHSPSTGHTHVGPGTTPEPPPWQPAPMDPTDPVRPINPMQPDPMQPDPMQPDPMQPDPMQPPAADPLPDTALSFNSPQAGLGSPDAVFNAPNMMGDLLKGFRNVAFTYNGAGDGTSVDSAGAVTLRNSKVSENNSAIPRDRVSFRYNYFHNANDVNGFTLGGSAGIPGLPEIRTVIPASKSYDAHFYTFGLEKTFLDNLASIELRVPFATTLDSDLNLIGAVPIRNDILAPRNIPNDGVLGNTDTELQDISFILKGVLWQSQDRRTLVSGGAGFSIPTGEDVNIFVVDTYDDFQGNEPPPPNSLNNPFTSQAFNPAFPQANNTRTRDIWVENEVYEFSPYLAMASVPTDNLFVNAFAQMTLPLGSADVRYREERVDVFTRDFFPGATGVGQFGTMFGPNGSEGRFEQKAKIRDQALLQLDIGGGYWLYRNPQAQVVTGLASLLELHYTTTVEDADIVTFQPGGSPLIIQGTQSDREGPTRVGNLANRIDILNATIGGVFELCNTATLAAGYVVPLRDDFDRTFDGELNIQFNWYK